MENKSNFWLLGDSFYRGYYLIHDEDNARLGVAPHATSVKRDVEIRLPGLKLSSDDLIKGKFSKAWTFVETLGVVLLIAVIIVVFVIWIYPAIKKCFDKTGNKGEPFLAVINL